MCNLLSLTFIGYQNILHDFSTSLYFPDRRQYPAWIVSGTTTADINNQHIDDITELQETEIQKQIFSTNLHALMLSNGRVSPYH